MTIVKINNPYFDKSYKVVEDKGDIKYTLKNIDRGNQRFLHLHDYETGDSITISPACCASIDFKAENEVRPLANGDWIYGNESPTVSYSDRTESED